MIINNVYDRHRRWIGSWEVEPLRYDALGDSDVGRTVIYRDSHARENSTSCRAEAGVISSFRNGKVWARYSTGSTAAAAEPSDLSFGIKPLDGPSIPDAGEGEI